MNMNITRKNVGFFGWTYAQYLEQTHPEAWDRFVKREDHLDLLKKYSAHCQGEMKLFMEALKIACHLKSRNDLEPGLQQDVFDAIVYETKLKTMLRLIDVDETTLQVLHEPGKKTKSDGYRWRGVA